MKQNTFHVFTLLLFISRINIIKKKILKYKYIFDEKRMRFFYNTFNGSNSLIIF